LVERAQEQFDAKEAAELQKKIAKNQFNLNDFLGQLQQIKKMGNIKDLMAMVPGMGKAMKDVDIDNDSFKHIEAIIQSMTLEEREKPEILSGPRKKRIATGSGRTVQDVNKLLKQFEDMRKMMKMFTSGNAQKMMRNMPARRP
jgi:signal recognition particle subunit SRP54